MKRTIKSVGIIVILVILLTRMTGCFDAKRGG